MGGLGCGWFEIRQDGTFQNWNIFNNQPSALGKAFPYPAHSVLFFLLRVQVEGSEPFLRLLQIEESHGAAGIEVHEFQYVFPWISGIDWVEYEGSVPFSRLRFADERMPLAIKLTAWSPLVPHDVKNSSLPAAFFDLSVQSMSHLPVTVTLLASLRNCVGYDWREKTWSGRRADGDGFRGFEMTCEGVDPKHASFGTMGLASLYPDSLCWMGWGHVHPYYEQLLREGLVKDVDETLLRNGRDHAEGALYAKHECYSTIGRTVHLPSFGTEASNTFLFTWNFPNRYARTDQDEESAPVGYIENVAVEAAVHSEVPVFEGHYYNNFFTSSSEVARYVIDQAETLREKTTLFHSSFFESTLPDFVLSQINSHLNTFRTSSWLTKAGDFGILEGLSPTKSFAGLATVDVAMYGQVMTSALFPELDRSVIRAHNRMQQENGIVCHSIAQNFQTRDMREAGGRRVDLPGQFAYLAMRVGLWSDDRDFLSELWPSVKRALDYVLRERDADGNGLPDMEGIMCSYDNFPMYGVAPYVATQWLAAITAAIEVGQLLKDEAAVSRYRKVLEKGTAALEAEAWNGSYYRLSSRGEEREGCLSDQIIGQWACRLLDLPSFLNENRVRGVLQKILKSNYRPDQGLRNCQWPGDAFLHPVADDCWVDQANTCWTGVELAFASLLIYEGLVDEGFEIIRNVDERYRRWGIYWDHQEFGGHYFRPMSAWAILPAILGLQMRSGVVTFAPKISTDPLKLLFVTTDGYGFYRRENNQVSLEIISGCLRARELRFGAMADSDLRLTDGHRRWLSEKQEGLHIVRFENEETFPEGSRLTLVSVETPSVLVSAEA
jgi:non-lysosomal glucosylceramidase